MKENMPILYQNIMDGLPSGVARDAFLWATERAAVGDVMLYGAEKFAREVHGLVAFIGPMLDESAYIFGAEKHDPDLMAFILKRHANMTFGGNQSVKYAEMVAA